MPEIGEIQKWQEVGYKGIGKAIWSACIDCGKERWVEFRHDKHLVLRCHTCARKRQSGDKHPNWKGGRLYHKAGYIQVLLPKNSFFYSMADSKGYVLEHRLVVAKALGRCLQLWEKVHHKGIRYAGVENKQDNLKDNLELCGNQGEHIASHSKGYRDGYQKGLIDGRNKQIRILQKTIEDLQNKCGDWQPRRS